MVGRKLLLGVVTSGLLTAGLLVPATVAQADSKNDWNLYARFSSLNDCVAVQSWAPSYYGWAASFCSTDWQTSESDLWYHY